MIGVDVPLSGPLTIGVEGNLHAGTNAIDFEYGAAARLGYCFPSGGLVYARAGYQWVDVDAAALVGVDIDEDDLGISTTVDDYLLGIGGEFPIGTQNMRLRAGIDTVSFDTIRPTVGILMSF